MAQLNQFNPTQAFQTGRRNALSIEGQEQGIARENLAAPIRNQAQELGLKSQQRSFERTGVQNEQSDAVQKATILHNVAQSLASLPENQRAAAFSQIESKLATFGIETNNIKERGFSDGQLQLAISGTQGFLNNPSQLAQLSSGQRERGDLKADLEGAFLPNGQLKDVKDMTAIQRAAAIGLKLIPGAGTATGIERISSEQDIVKQVADAEKAITTSKEEGKLDAQGRLAPNIEKQKALAKDAAGLSTQLFKRLGGLEKNITNLREGIRLIDSGAASGPVDKWFPSYKPQTIALDNLKNRLGLDVIGSITFGALSEKELQVAFDTAVPSNLQPEALKAWFTERIEAQEKLLAAIEDAGIFLAEDGATIPKLMAKRRRERQTTQQGTQTEPQTQQFQEGQTATNAQGQSIIFNNGQWVVNNG